jgi:hypothetical protein
LRKRNFFLASIIAINLAFVVNVKAQTQQEQTRCNRLDINRPAHYLLYYGIHEEKEGQYRVRLKLTNNTSCKIIVETDDTMSCWDSLRDEGSLIGQFCVRVIEFLQSWSFGMDQQDWFPK